MKEFARYCTFFPDIIDKQFFKLPQKSEDWILKTNEERRRHGKSKEPGKG